MGAPIGNKNALGHDGSNAGRKSAYKEREDAELLRSVWYGEVGQDELEEIIKNRKHSPFLVWLAKAFSGDTKVLNKIADKLYSNKHEVDAPLHSEIIEKYRERLKQLINEEAEIRKDTKGEVGKDIPSV